MEQVNLQFKAFPSFFCEGIGVGVIWEELLTISKLLFSTYLKIKGICSLKALKLKRLKYTGENTGFLYSYIELLIVWMTQAMYG